MTAQPDDTVDPDGLIDEDVERETDQPAGDASPDEAPEPKDWEAEYKAQQRINRDLERRSKARLRDLERELAEARKGKPADGENKVDADAIRAEIRSEVESETLRERALDKLETRAARRFQNPEDARTFLASRVDEFIDGGKIDAQAVTDALDDLLRERPYLGITQGEPKDQKRFQGTGDQGPKGSAGKPQLSEADVKRLYKERRYDEIDKAREEGRLNAVLGITTT